MTARIGRIAPFVLLVFAFPRLGLAEPPVITWVSESVQGGETFLLCGDGFAAEKLQVLRWVPLQHPKEDWQKEETQRASLERFVSGQAAPPIEPPKDAQTCTIVACTANTLAARQPASNKPPSAQVCPQILWVTTAAGCSRPWIVNRPILWWATPEFPTPGSHVRVFGRNLISVYGVGRAAFLRTSDGRLRPVEWGMSYSPMYDGRITPLHEFELHLPADLPAGEYRLYVHAGAGGDLGWSEPLTLTVRAPVPEPAATIITVDPSADTDALQKACERLAASGGGTVQLGPGTYLIKHTLLVPAKVRIRGAGMGLTVIATPDDAGLSAEFPDDVLQNEARDYLKGIKQLAPMIALPEECALECLTVRGGRNTICIVVGGGQRIRRNMCVRDVEVFNRYPVWLPRGEYRFGGNNLVLAGPTENVVITGCRFEGAGGIFGMPGLCRRAIIAGNTFQSYPPGRFDIFSLRDPVECLVENNYFREAKRGIVVQPQPRYGQAVHNVFARNVIAHIHRGGNAGETELWEIVGARGFDVVKAAGADTLTAERVRWQPDEVKGFLCLIVAGRGLGQYRFVKSHTADTLTLDRPWIVQPGVGARFLVVRAAVENIILNSTDRDGEAALQLWGACVGNVIVGHICDDTEGIILWGADHRKQPGVEEGVIPCWFNDVRAARFEKGARLNLRPSRKPGKEYDDAGPLVFGNTFRECVFGDGPRSPFQNQWGPFWEWPHMTKKSEKWDMPGFEAAIALAGYLRWGADPDDPAWDELTPAVTFNLIERNFIQSWPVGVYQARSAKGNIIGDNTFFCTKQDKVIIGESPK